MQLHYLTALGQKRLLQLGLLLLVVTLTLMQSSSSQRAPVNEGVGRILDNRINTPLRLQVQDRELDQVRLRQLYAKNDYRPLWVGDRGPNLNAIGFRRCMENSGRDGLNPANYAPQLLQHYWADRQPEHLAELELLLSDLYLQFAADMYQGEVIPQAVDKDWHLPLDPVDSVAVLLEARDDDAFCHNILQLRPRHPQYDRLRSALAHYRALQAAGGWPLIPEGELVKVGMESADVPLVRQRLLISGDYHGAISDSRVYDQGLSEAVKRFQDRHAIYIDGTLGNETREAMSIPVAKRIAQLEANLERWRWVPRTLGYRYILVNAAGYELEVTEDHEKVLSMRVVVGKEERPTPVFTSDLQFVDLNPVWNVPHTIAVKDILPKLQRNPGFTAKENIEILSGWNQYERKINPYAVDWSLYSEKHFPFHLRQPAGGNNPLGTIRFLFPNSYDIYLHDTSHPELFAKAERNYSSGCIRVEQPMNLARYLLKDDSAWTMDKIQQEIRSGVSRRIQLGRTLPVYILYFTAWVDEQEGVHFYQDAYGRDRELLYEMGVPIN